MADLKKFIDLLTAYSKPYWKSLLLLLLSTFIVTVLMLIQPVLLSPILEMSMGNPSGDASLPAKASGILPFLDLDKMGSLIVKWSGFSASDRWRSAVFFGLLYAGVALLSNLLEFGNYMLALWIRVRAARDMQLDLFNHLLSQSFSFFTNQRAGNLISRLTNDTLATTSSLEVIIQSIVTQPILILCYGLLLLHTNTNLALMALGAAVAHSGFTKLISSTVRRRTVDQFDRMSNLTAMLQETFLSIRIVKSFAAEWIELRKLKTELGAILSINMRYGVYKHIEEPARSSFNALFYVGILLVGAHELILGQITMPGFFLFLFVGNRMVDPIAKLGSTVVQIQRTLGSVERVSQLFKTPSDIQSGSLSIKSFDTRLEVRNVSFSYNQTSVLNDVSLEVCKGEVVALVGPSGAGKSTLVDLLLRFYDPQQGVIEIDGVSIRDLRIPDYRMLFGVVSQECLLFNATIEENISYGRDSLSFDEVAQAAKTANAHDFIMGFPQDYKTVVGDRGIRLSGGQRQRIAIARAIAGHPSILVLDEATSALDSESEKQVQHAIERVIVNSTAIIIAHRLSTILHADKIFVIDEGRIKAIGKHVDLLKSSSLYQRLYRSQFEPHLTKDAIVSA